MTCDTCGQPLHLVTDADGTDYQMHANAAADWACGR